MICVENETSVICDELTSLAEEILSSFAVTINRNKCVVTNNIPAGISLNTDRDIVASVMGGMLSSILTNARNSSIDLRANFEGEMVVIHVKDHNNLNYLAVENSLTQLKPLAEKLDGFVGITRLGNRITTVTFRFPNPAFIY